MVDRQKVLGDFGEFALASESLDEILQRACELVARALGTRFAKILEIDHQRNDLLVKAGVGWPPGVVGVVRLPMSEHSSETYSIEQGVPVVTPDINQEDRFEFPSFMKAQGIVSIINVPIFLPGLKREAYGLLQVDSPEVHEFGDEEQQFLRTYTTILGPVIDRLHKIQELQLAFDQNQRLLHALQHRIKNHLGIVRRLVSMRERVAGTEEAHQELAVIGERIETLRLVHEHLYSAGTVGHLPAGPYLTALAEGLCKMHEGGSGAVRLDLSIMELELTPNTAVPLGLILNEFVTNSLKYAFDGQGGVITLDVRPHPEGRIRVCLSDSGKGLPAEPAPEATGTGVKLIEGLSRQLGAQPVWSRDHGTTLCLEFVPT